MYMNIPQYRLTLGSTVYTNQTQIDVSVVRRENAVDTATLTLADPQRFIYPSLIAAGTAVTVEVKDSYETTWTTLFKGVTRVPVGVMDNGDTAIVNCDGAGYGLIDNVAAIDYGEQSSNPTLDTVSEILTDAAHGLIPKWVNHYMESATDTGFNYTTTNVDAVTGTIPYLLFTYKPITKCLDDLCDLVTAIKAVSGAITAGPHWIVDIADDLHVKLIDGTQATWTKYLGGATNTGQATLVEGADFLKAQFESLGPEANVVVYSGMWRRPSVGDTLYSEWTKTEANTTLASGTAIYIVGSTSVKTYTTANPSGAITVQYPTAKAAAWDFSSFTDFNTPNLNFYVYYDLVLTDHLDIRLCTDANNYYELIITPSNQKWVHYSFPVGPYFNVQGNNSDTQKLWVKAGAGANPNWNNINWVEIYCSGAEMYNGGTERNCFFIDGLHFGNAAVIRVATNSTSITANKCKVKVVTDNVGKDDTLKSGTLGTTDTGLLARMAYAELLRLQKTSETASFTTPMLKDLLPGQWVHLHAKKKIDNASFAVDKDFRVTKLTHTINSGGCTTLCDATDDLTNSHARLPYENQNRIWAATRPEFQDRQATSQKIGDLDIRVARLTEDYP
jgi:hypothetical protein